MTQDSSPTEVSTAETPHELCGYLVDSCLKPDQTFLAIGPGGRGIVLKKLDPDCLLRGLLHPSIRERLARVRELAHAGVANLYGVGRDAGQAWLIWEYVPGQTFGQYLSQPRRTARDLLLVARELILAVDALHMQGIVHGAIIAGNVIVGPDGSVRLTHVSPLLYTEMSADVESVIASLRDAIERVAERGSSLSQLVDGAGHDQAGLRALAARIGTILENRGEPHVPQLQAQERSLRRRTLVAALLIAILGLALGYGLWRATDLGPVRGSAPPGVPVSGEK